MKQPTQYPTEKRSSLHSLRDNSMQEVKNTTVDTTVDTTVGTTVDTTVGMDLDAILKELPHEMNEINKTKVEIDDEFKAALNRVDVRLFLFKYNNFTSWVSKNPNCEWIKSKSDEKDVIEATIALNKIFNILTNNNK